jgi:DNA ligase D-like protein (predicted ligase)
MLAKPGEPFDSGNHLFEIKWDGTRTVAFIESGRYRLVNRRRVDMTDRYPEFDFLRQLPAGTVLDGETIVLKDGVPSFHLLQSREQARSPLKICSLAAALPAMYVVFDLLYESYQSIMAEPLSVRRDKLSRLVLDCGQARLVLSQGIIGQGKAFFEEVVQQGLEGVVAKRLASRYLPGKRTDAWVKIKRSESTFCAIIGFVPSGKDDFQSLILAAETDGSLSCVGKVGTGFDRAMRDRLNRWLWSNLQQKPIVPSRIKGKWVAPGLYCKVRFMERTPGGEFRAPVFAGLVED